MQKISTHSTGQQPCRARLHTCATNAGNRAGSWWQTDATLRSMHATAASVVDPTFERMGAGTIERPAQHLSVRAT